MEQTGAGWSSGWEIDILAGTVLMAIIGLGALYDSAGLVPVVVAGALIASVVCTAIHLRTRDSFAFTPRADLTERALEGHMAAYMRGWIDEEALEQRIEFTLRESM